MIPINAVNCNKNKKGTGLVKCLLKLKQYKSMFLVTDPTWKLSVADDTFDAEYIVSKVQDGTFVPFLNTVEFTNNTADVTKKEYQDGDTAVIRNGKPDYTFEFNNGPLWHEAASSYNSFREYGIILIDKAGTLEGARSVDEQYIKPYALNYFNTATYVPEAGDETPKTLVSFQIRNEEEYNSRKALLPAESLGLDINEDIFGVVDVNIAGTASVANGLNFTVTADINDTFGIKALAADNFRVINTATNAVIPFTTVTVGPSEGQYKITPTTALTLGTKVRVETYDTSVPTATARIEDTNQLYKGASPELTTAA